MLCKVKRIAERVCKRHYLPLPIVTKKTGNCGDTQYEIRSEFCTYDREFTEITVAFQKQCPDWILEPSGGCVYVLYRPF